MSKFDDFMKSLPKRLVETDSGAVEGYIVDGVAHFKGIPYAAAPVGALRWRPPQPRETWKEPLMAHRIGKVCPQDSANFPVIGTMGEDCLSLNIFAPENTAGKACPVMAWIHGGGFSTGSGIVPIYDGSYLAAAGMVVVTMNYRLGALGFLAHPELTGESGHSGNYGLMDQIFALQWIKRNIAAFGGDPGNVTIFGESAGGTSVAMLMASPLAGGLFQRAAAQSPGSLPHRLRELDGSSGPFESAEAFGLRFAGKLGLEGKKGVTAKLRNMPAEELAAAWFKTVNEDYKGVGASGSWIVNHITIDGKVLEQAPGEVFRKGRQHNVPFMTGNTADEGTLFTYLFFGREPDGERYRHYAGQAYGKEGRAVAAHFGGRDGEDVRRASDGMLGASFYSGSRRLARYMSAVQSHTYRYLFSKPPGFFLYVIPDMHDWKERFRCYHAAEIPYVFHWMGVPGYGEEDRALARQMAGFWANFARSGDPNGGGNTWPRFSRQDESYLALGEEVFRSRGFRDADCDFIDGLEA
jgi:para-nitrobenzyl esterase